MQTRAQDTRPGQDGLEDSSANAAAWNAFLSAEVHRYLSAFQRIPIAVALEGADETTLVHVHAPYMMGTVRFMADEEAFARLKPRHQDRLLRVQRAREQATEEVRAFLSDQFYGDDERERWVAGGRSGWEDIGAVLQAAVDRGLVPAGAGRSHPDGSDLRQWLKRYGIGVDCSAFVQHALTDLVRASSAAVGDTSDRASDYTVGWLRSPGVYVKLTTGQGGETRFDPVSMPSEARPGDVLLKRGHMRIVAAVEREADGPVTLRLAESISAAGVPHGQACEEADIGPRLIHIRYPQADHPIGEQTPLCRRSSQGAFEADREERAYILGRLRTLVQLVTAPITRQG